MLILKNITKTYPGVVALNNVSMSVQDGEVHALLGENGAGKSTLIKIIAGAVEPDSGSIGFDEKEFHKMTPQLSQENGVAVIYQELNLCAPLTVAENIFLGEEAKFGKVLISRKKMVKEARKVLDNTGFTDVDPAAPIESLNMQDRKLVEIGAQVKMGDVAATVNGEPMVCTLDGILRGILADGTPVHKGMKAGELVKLVCTTCGGSGKR